MAMNQELKNGIVEQMRGLKEQDKRKASNKASNEPVEVINDVKDEIIEETVKEPVQASNEPTEVSDNTNMYSSLVITEKKEIKSKRVNFMVKASSHADFKAKCETLGVSMNDVIDRFMADFSKK